MNIEDYPLRSGQWYAEPQRKTHIVWHGTQGRTAKTPYHGHPGRATSSIDGWNDSPDHVGTPYLIDRDGTIYRTFKNDAEWIYHLGLKGTGGHYDKASVGIELANELELKKKDDSYYAFDRISDDSRYIGDVVRANWREQQYFAALDRAQVDGAIELTLDICARHQIPKRFFYPSTQFDEIHCFEVASIVCHSNCREDKTDLYLEGWVWEKLRANGVTLIDREGKPC